MARDFRQFATPRRRGFVDCGAPSDGANSGVCVGGGMMACRKQEWTRRIRAPYGSFVGVRCQVPMVPQVSREYSVRSVQTGDGKW